MKIYSLFQVKINIRLLIQETYFFNFDQKAVYSEQYLVDIGVQYIGNRI